MHQTYSIDELLALRWSPLVYRPLSLRPLEEWIGTINEESRPKATTKARNTTYNSSPGTRTQESKIAKDTSHAADSKSSSMDQVTGFERSKVHPDRQIRFQTGSVPPQNERILQDKFSNWDRLRKNGPHDDDESLHRAASQNTSYELARRRNEGSQREEIGTEGNRTPSIANARAQNWRTAISPYKETRRVTSRATGNDKQRQPDWFKDDTFEEVEGDKGHTAADVEAWKTTMKKSRIRSEGEGLDQLYDATIMSSTEDQASEKPRKFRVPLSVETSRDGFYDTLDAATTQNQSVTSIATASIPAHEIIPRSSRFTNFFGSPQVETSAEHMACPPVHSNGMRQVDPMAAVGQKDLSLSNQREIPVQSQQADRAGFERILQMLGSPRHTPHSEVPQASARLSSVQGQRSASPVTNLAGNLRQSLSLNQPWQQSAPMNGDPPWTKPPRSNEDSEYLLQLLRNHGPTARPQISEPRFGPSQNPLDRHMHGLSHLKDNYRDEIGSGQPSYPVPNLIKDGGSSEQYLNAASPSNQGRSYMYTGKGEQILVPMQQFGSAGPADTPEIYNQGQLRSGQHLSMAAPGRHMRSQLSDHMRLQ